MSQIGDKMTKLENYKLMKNILNDFIIKFGIIINYQLNESNKKLKDNTNIYNDDYFDSFLLNINTDAKNFANLIENKNRKSYFLNRINDSTQEASVYKFSGYHCQQMALKKVCKNYLDIMEFNICAYKKDNFAQIEKEKAEQK